MVIVEFEHGLQDNVRVKDEDKTPGVVVGMTITNLGRSYCVVYPYGESQWHEEDGIEKRAT